MGLALVSTESLKRVKAVSARAAKGRLQDSARIGLRARYDRLWSEAIGKILSGKPELDPVLAERTPDLRRGLTLMARPAPIVRRRVLDFLTKLRRVEPAQYYYTASELHLTVLSLFTATVEHVAFFARTDAYLESVDSALRNVPPIRIEFEGVTASPGTVMIQGFFENNCLNNLRDRLREELQARGLEGGVDRRYRLETAHMTVARFRSPLRNSTGFAQVLEQARRREFGATSITSVSIVKNDWYMSREALETVKRYRLSRTNRS